MKKHFLAVCILAALPFQALAADISNTYVEAGYVYADFDYFDSDGGYLRGSYALNDSFYILGGYQHRGYKGRYGGEYGQKSDSDIYSLGLGYQVPVSQRWYFTTELAYNHSRWTHEYTGPYGDGRSTGSTGITHGNIGFRGQTSERTELWVKAQYADGNDTDGQFSGLIGGQFKVTPVWSIVGEAGILEASELSSSSHYEVYNVGVRASF